MNQAGAFVALDVTALVQGWIANPASNNGLALSAGTAFVQFDSKENDQTSHAATLDVELVDAGPAGATGAAGVAGPQGIAGRDRSGWPDGAYWRGAELLAQRGPRCSGGLRELSARKGRRAGGGEWEWVGGWAELPGDLRFDD